jgi:hypothetical protein
MSKYHEKWKNKVLEEKIPFDLAWFAFIELDQPWDDPLINNIIASDLWAEVFYSVNVKKQKCEHLEYQISKNALVNDYYQNKIKDLI